MKNTRKGFTLIELLAVIVILAIIALIAVPIILNVIETAKNGAAESSALGYIDEIEKQVMINQVLNTNLIEAGEYEKATLDSLNVKVKGGTDITKLKVRVNAKGQVEVGKFCINNKSIYYNGKKAQYKKDENYCEGELTLDGAPTKKYTIENDANSNGTADVGDEIAVGDEHFYVISNDGTTLNALAKYNLNVGNTCTSSSSCTPIENPTVKQDASMTGYYNSIYGNGSVAFSNAVNWTEEEDGIEAKATGTLHDALYGENGYEKYIQQTAPSAAVRLIKKSELDDLKNNQGNPSWLYSTSYWSGSAIYLDAAGVWSVRSDGNFSSCGYRNGSIYGVRPVITIAA